MFNSLGNTTLTNYILNNEPSQFKKQIDKEIDNIEKTFTTNVLKKIFRQSEIAIKKYLGAIQKKDKSILKSIDNDVGFNFNLNVVGELELLQQRGYKLGSKRGLQYLSSQFNSDEDLAQFALVKESDLLRDPDTQELTGKAVDLPLRYKKINPAIDTISNEDVVETIRYYDVTEKLKTIENLDRYTNNLYYESKDFRDEYMSKRNINVAQNFTNKYKDQIKTQISKYIEKGTDIRREKDLVELLTGQQVKLPDVPSEQQIQKRKTIGLRQEVIDDPQAYKDLFKGDYYRNSPNARVERIAKTELPIAYNLGSLDVFLDYGYDTFKILNDPYVDNCKLCVSLQNKTKDPNNYITLEDLASINYRPGTNNFYGIDFRSIRTDKTWNESPNNTQRIIAPVFHPNCYCRIVPVKRQSKKKLAQKKQAIKNQTLLKNTVGVINNIGTAVGVHNAVVNTLDEIGLQQKLKEEENKKNLYKLLIAGTSILSMGTMYFYFYKNYLKNIDNKVSQKIAKDLFVSEVSPIEREEVFEQIQKAIEPLPEKILTKTEQALEELGATQKTPKELGESNISEDTNYTEKLKEFNSLYKQIDQILKGDLSRLTKKVNDLEGNRLTYTPDELDQLKYTTKQQIENLLGKVDSLDKKVEDLFEYLYLNQTDAKNRKQLSNKYNKYNTTIDKSIRNKINKLFDRLNYINSFKHKNYNIVEFKRK